MIMTVIVTMSMGLFFTIIVMIFFRSKSILMERLFR
jgi:hypothetical protein